jgi:hypothetical protein
MEIAEFCPEGEHSTAESGRHVLVITGLTPAGQADK